jgi:hypothetical protein
MSDQDASEESPRRAIDRVAGNPELLVPRFPKSQFLGEFTSFSGTGCRWAVIPVG